MTTSLKNCLDDVECLFKVAEGQVQVMKENRHRLDLRCIHMASGINIYSVFWISKILILDINNKVGEILYFGYPELQFCISRMKYLFQIS